MSAPEPMRRKSSAAGSVVSVPTPLRHPTPDLQSLQGAYVRNVQKLERSAEELSQSGSDIGEEIRRLSRQSSIQSSRNGETSYVRPSVLERMNSNYSTRSSRSASHSRNIVDVNGAARWGGYSPGGFVTSPVGSVSGWSRTSVSRVTSDSNKSSRLSRVTEPMQEPMQEGRPLDSPLRTNFNVPDESQPVENDDTLHARDGSQSSFARRYDEIAGQIEDSLQHVPPSPPKDRVAVNRNQALHQLEIGGSGASTPPSRRQSTDTYREAQEAFHDFDGVHFSPETEEFVELDPDGNEIRRVSARSVSGGLSIEAAQLLRTPRAQLDAQGVPPPAENMVYYPAPVPRILNLPKRLSQLPAASVQSKRRTQVLSQLPPEARAAGPWLSQENVVDSPEPDERKTSGGNHNRQSSEVMPRGGFLNERMSANVANVPAHLRASMFFEHPSIQQNVQIQGESAVKTLDSILAASANAPVRAFTDHPFAGDVRHSVYSLEKNQRRSTATIGTQSTPEKKKKRRSTSISAILKRSSTDEITTTLNKRSSKASILTDLTDRGSSKLRKRSSRLSLGDELNRDNDLIETPGDEISEPDLHRRSGLIASAQNATLHDAPNRVSVAPTVMSSGYRLDDAEQIENDFKVQENQEDVDLEEEEPIFVQPSTLLAELQVRKAQQKKRNKTAATAFPNGMHSTLLQMDAVEEINKRKRKNQRIALAWEDPHQRALEADLDLGDEDVPLGMLYPSKNGATTRKVGDGKDWDRPLGLMEKRELEDNEPLSNRRHRLRGGRPTSPPMQMADEDQVEGAEGEGEDGDVGETLAQRMRRMKTKDALDTAIVDVAPRTGERPLSTFTDDVMGQFGGKEAQKASPDPQNRSGASPQPDDKETLGQRRARLQREREAGGNQRNISDPAAAAQRPPMLRSATSLANLLSANPTGMRAKAKNAEPVAGSLLATNATNEARQKTALKNTNLRSSSYYLEKPLVDSKPQSTGHVNANGLLSQQHESRARAGGFAAGTYNNGMGGIQLQQPMSPPAYASPTANAQVNGYYGMNYPNGYGNGMMGYPQMQMQQQMGYQNPMAYHQGMMGSGFTGNAFVPQTMGGGTYASYAQNMGGMGMGMNTMDYESLNPNQRAAIDRWRMGVGS